jgi:hypothetical protein
MPTKRYIAVVTELNWSYKRHYEIFAGRLSGNEVIW